jgi:ribonuclease HII
VQIKMTLKTQTNIVPPLEDLEATLVRKGYRFVCGVDEVGRGPLAGPVVAAAVIMPEGITIDRLNDSKLLTEIERERIFETIADLGLPCAVGVIDHETIDRINILKASLMAMRKAIMELKQSPDFVIVDGKFTIPNLNLPQYAVACADGNCKCVAAASVVAKVTRDRIMDRMQALYPSFTFSQHKGYATPQHLDELRTHGPCDIHRRSYQPVAEYLEQYALL